MLHRAIFVSILLSLLFGLNGPVQRGDFPVHTGPYLGQKQARFIGKNASSEQITKNWSGLFFSGQSCTVFYASDKHMALAGNNEDYNFLSTNILFLPAEEGKFGRIYFGSDVAHFP